MYICRMSSMAGTLELRALKAGMDISRRRGAVSSRGSFPMRCYVGGFEPLFLSILVGSR